MNSSPLVSVITVTYNNADYLKQCIDSVLNQSLEDWEWLVVNNGSNDATEAILGKVQDSRIEVINLSDNLGVSAGRNEGLKRMKGEYFCFLDGDDVMPPESLRSRAEILQNDKDIGAADGSTVTFEGELSNVIDRYTPSFEGIPMEPLLRLDGTCFFGNTWMIRRRKVDYAFRSELKHGEELLFYAEFAGKLDYTYTDETVLFYRKHSSSAMNNLDGLMKGYDKIAANLGQVDGVSRDDIRNFRMAARRIMFRSFLKNMQPIRAIKAWIDLTP